MALETPQKKPIISCLCNNHLTAIKTYVIILANKGVIGTLHPGCNKTANTSANSGFI